MLNFTHTLVVHNVHFLRRGFLEFLASTARIRNTKKKKKEKEEERDGREREREEEETSQHPPFLFSFEKKRGKREREMGRQATGSRGQKAFLCSSSARGLGYPVALQSCHTRGRELNKFPEDVGSRGWRGEKAGEGRMSAGKNETRSSSGKVVPAKQKTSPSPSSSCSPRA